MGKWMVMINVWGVFLITSVVGEFKPWAWMVWGPLLFLATASPILWMVFQWVFKGRK